MTTDDPETPTPEYRERLSIELLDYLRNGAEAVINGSFLFRSLDATARQELADRGVVMVFQAGREVIREGETGDDFFLMDHGVVEVTTRGPTGPVVLSTLQRGAFFGEVAMLTGMPRTATVTALTDASVIRFSREEIDPILNRDPGARRLLETMIEGRARDAVEKVVRASVPASGIDEP